MVLKNNSSKIIGIQETSILPGETAKCPEGYENNPVIKKYIKVGTFSVVQEGNSENVHSSGNVLKAESETDASGEDGKNLEDMSEDELVSYAVKNNIEIGKASTKEGILKKIQEAQKNM